MAKCRHEGVYTMNVDGAPSEPAGSTFWQAFRSAEEARDRGAARVEVHMQGLNHGPVFVLVPRAGAAREADRIRNTVDPGLWMDVLDRIADTGKK
jgi:hypothetical protein